MSTGDQTASASVVGQPDLRVRFSREFLNGLFAQLQAIDLQGQQSGTEPVGLLFGLVDAASVRLEKFEPVHLAKSNETDLLDPEAAEGVLEKSVSEARMRLSPGLAVTGWYTVRAVEHRELLGRDIGIHNKCFKSDRDVMLIVRPEPTGHLTLEVYTAKPHSSLATYEHRRGLLRVASVNGLVEGGAEVSLTGIVNNGFFLKVYEASKSLDRARRREKWAQI